MVERAFILPPASRIGPVTDTERTAIVKSSVLFGHYEQAVDRESAYEKLKGRTAAKQEATTGAGATSTVDTAAPAAGGGLIGMLGEVLLGKTGPRGGHTPGILDAAAKSAARTMGSQVGREIIRGVLGSIMGGRKR
jgi:hypothetical protein